jgi:hypothetical protein
MGGGGILLLSRGDEKIIVNPSLKKKPIPIKTKSAKKPKKAIIEEDYNALSGGNPSLCNHRWQVQIIQIPRYLIGLGRQNAVCRFCVKCGKMEYISCEEDY